MRRPVLANLDDLDPETRGAAEAAARRAGLRLEDWVDGILSDRLAQHRPPSQPFKHRPAADDLDLMIARMAKAARKPTADAPDPSARTASAIEALARWFAQEEHLAEHSPDSEDRLASAMSDALLALKGRLDALERRAVAEPPPSRIEFPVEEAMRALSPLADTLVGLRTDVSRLADRLDQPLAAQSGREIEVVATQIDDLKAALAALATRDEIDALDSSLQNLSRDLDKRPSGTAVLTLSGAIATLHGQVADLSDELRQGLHVDLGSAIEGVERKIDRLAQSGVDRSVIDFLSSQIVDLRHDLSNRAEPRQIERLAAEVASLRTQITELRLHQVGRADFASLKTALENVCGALAQSIASQQANDVPDLIRVLGDKLDVLAQRSAPEPALLDPIAAQLTLLTERMAGMADQRFDESETVQAQLDRLSSQIGCALETSSMSQSPLWERFDKLEAGLRQLGERADPSSLEALVRALDEKLQPTASPKSLKALQDEAMAIAERAARTAIREHKSGASSTDVAALKHGFAELKSLQARAESKTHQTLQAVHEALETLVARFADPDLTAQPRTAVRPLAHGTKPADRLEAAVRRLHAAALSQIEEVSGGVVDLDPARGETSIGPEQARMVGASISGQEPDLGNVRSSFIAAARRASQTSGAPHAGESDISGQPPAAALEAGDATLSGANPLSTPSLIQRLRRTIDSNRRPLLFSVALLVLMTGTVEFLSGSSKTGTVPEVAVVTPDVDRRMSDLPASMFQFPSLAGAALPSSGVGVTTFKDIADGAPETSRQAVGAGSPAALYAVANRLDRPQDQAEAARLFEKAAQAGLAPAQQRIGAIYEQGRGVERDLPRAVTWYERAASGGNLEAMHHLATLLASGVQGEPDYAGAFRWYTEAAERGLKDSQFNLGVLFTRGVGTRQSLPRAYQWFDVAARQGDSDAASKRNEIAKRLSPPELAAAKLLAERWRARPVDRAANGVQWPGDERTASLDRRLGGGT